MAKKTYRVLRTFGLEGAGFFVEGTEVEVEVAAERPAKSTLPFMSLRREQELLADGRIKPVERKAGKKEEVTHAQIQEP